MSHVVRIDCKDALRLSPCKCMVTGLGRGGEVADLAGVLYIVGWRKNWRLRLVFDVAGPSWLEDRPLHSIYEFKCFRDSSLTTYGQVSGCACTLEPHMYEQS